MCATLLNAEERILQGQKLSLADFSELIEQRTPERQERLADQAVVLRKQYYGTDVYVRGLIEFSNYCKNNCLYCGIRRDARQVERYRLTEEEILACCAGGYELGYRTFVLQSGEDGYCGRIPPGGLRPVA